MLGSLCEFWAWLFKPAYKEESPQNKDILLGAVIVILVMFLFMKVFSRFSMNTEDNIEINCFITAIGVMVVLSLTRFFLKSISLSSEEIDNIIPSASANQQRADIEPKSIDPVELWAKYLGYLQNTKLGVSGSRLRVIIHSIVFILAAATLMSISEFPNIPARGQGIVFFNCGVLLLSVGATVALTTWVVEHARLCERLIFHLASAPSRWNVNAKQHAHNKGVAPECVNEWLDLKMVVKLTETLQPLIWGPMTCAGLMLLARSTAIDDWDIPPALATVLAILFLYAISAEFLLQRGSKNARRKAIEQLTEKLCLYRNAFQPNEAAIKRIETQIEQAKALRDGAFRPWYDWPLFQAFGGVGALIAFLYQLTEYLILQQ
ncbi:hypothetical protein A1507_14405 [Methylomonas koyamae]|uniref:Uncharacterized protein n=1 Tax=Methylomonas koyamae TaxID=702114 RepID=A0A177NDZ3_9GAMM|nr:hypothetical protein [Methylomonas koyamae]OAI15389.1 hypothetical protein A1507_14405 [Methylomonas koyamae]